MREIKFRAWSKKYKIFCWNGRAMTLQDLAIIEHSPEVVDELVYLQYTGLNDKYGKEVYEGDILASGYRKGDVEFYRGIYVVREMNGQGLLSQYLKADFEVIGNIYENPELLN